MMRGPTVLGSQSSVLSQSSRLVGILLRCRWGLGFLVRLGGIPLPIPRSFGIIRLGGITARSLSLKDLRIKSSRINNLCCQRALKMGLGCLRAQSWLPQSDLYGRGRRGLSQWNLLWVHALDNRYP